MTLKSTARSSVTFIPLFPSTYSPSVFSLKNIQSIPSLGTFTGLTLANKSSSRRMATFALSILGHLSPFFGVYNGPFNKT